MAISCFNYLTSVGIIPQKKDFIQTHFEYSVYFFTKNIQICTFNITYRQTAYFFCNLNANILVFNENLNKKNIYFFAE